MMGLNRKTISHQCSNASQLVFVQTSNKDNLYQLVLAIPCAKSSFRILRVARASSSKANLQVLLDTRRICINRLWCIRYTIFMHIASYTHIYIICISIVANSSILWCCSVWPWPSTPPVQEPLDWPRNCRTRQQMAANTTHNSIIPFFVVYILYILYYICIYIYILYCVLGGECSRTLRDLGLRFPASEPSIAMPGKMSHHVSICHKTSNDFCVPFLRYPFVLVLLAPPRSACSTGRSL